MKYIGASLLIITLLITSCKSNTSNEIQDEIDSTVIEVIDTITNIEIDTTSSLPDSLQKAGYVDETNEVEKEIEKKYGKQWDFCDCVVKNDSINKVFENPDLSDEDFDKAFARMEEIDNHCKTLLTAPNTTPDERDRHKRKVRKCLKEAGIK